MDIQHLKMEPFTVSPITMKMAPMAQRLSPNIDLSSMAIIEAFGFSTAIYRVNHWSISKLGLVSTKVTKSHPLVVNMKMGGGLHMFTSNCPWLNHLNQIYKVLFPLKTEKRRSKCILIRETSWATYTEASSARYAFSA